MERARVSPSTSPQVTRHRLLILAGAVLIAGFVLLLVIGSLRYGGPEELLFRVRSEFVASKPHPELVPTPFPTPTGGPALAILAPSPTPTPPPPTPTPSPPGLSPTDEEVLSSLDAMAALVVVPTDLPERITATPTASPTPLPTATPTEEPAAVTSPGNVQLAGLAHYWQTWNNCGPATLAMNLSYFGSALSQKDTAAVLKPNRNDKNVNPEEIAAYARSQGLGALVRVNGDLDRLQRLVEAGVPVLIETWLDHDGGMGHYRLVTGYDQGRREFTVYDSYVSEGVDPDKPYVGIRIPFDELARLWRVFNGTHVVIYDDARVTSVQEILGPDLDDAAMWQRSLERAQVEAQAQPDDAFAWFNLGTNLAASGRYQEAASAFDQARVLGLPWRMLWYQFGPFVAYFETGRFQELVALADATIATAGDVEETFYWRGKGLQAMGDLEGARQAYQRAVELNANYGEATTALAGLAP